MELSTKYNPAEVEEKWYKYWMENGFFHSEPDEREPYTVVIPPPNVTGVLHMGHMLNNTIQDVLVRRARMQGKNACWVPGTDHASIATEAKVVAKLAAEGINKTDLTREEFLEHAWEWTHKHGGIILEQLKKLGCSCDWDRTAFTMDEQRSESVLKVFCDLYDKGKIYRGVRMVNWDPKALTALSDEEVNHKEQQGKLYYLKYRIAHPPTSKEGEAPQSPPEGGGREFAQMAVNIVEIVDDDVFPTVVKCEMTDIYGKKHTFIDKMPIVYSECVLPNYKFPVQGFIRGKIISQNNEKVIFNIETPDYVESIEGKTEFEMTVSQIKKQPESPEQYDTVAASRPETPENDILAEFQEQLSGFSEEKRQKINAALRQIIENTTTAK